MKLLIDNNDVSVAMMEWPRIILENQQNNRFTIVASVSNLRLKKNQLPVALYDSIEAKELLFVEIYNDFNVIIFSGFYNGSGFVENRKADEIFLEVFSLLNRPKEIDFTYQKTASVSQFVGDVTNGLGQEGLWKPGSYKVLNPPYKLQVHWPLRKVFADLLQPLGVGSNEDCYFTFGMITRETDLLDGFEILVDRVTPLKLYWTLARRTLSFIGNAGDVDDFTPSWVTAPVQDKGEIKQTRTLWVHTKYYIDRLPTERIEQSDILYGLISIFNVTGIDWDDIVFDFNYEGNYGDALLDLAQLTDSNIYYDERQYGYIVPQDFQLGSSEINNNYILNISYKFTEETFQEGIEFKGIDVGDKIEEFREYYRQRAYYEKKFHRTEVEVKPYPGLDDIRLFNDIINYGQVAKVDKSKNKYIFSVVE